MFWELARMRAQQRPVQVTKSKLMSVSCTSAIPPASVTGGVRVIAASRRRIAVGTISAIGRRGGHPGCACIHRSAVCSAARNARERHWRQWTTNDVNKYGGFAVRPVEIALKHIDVEGELVAFELRRLQHHDSVLNA